MKRYYEISRDRVNQVLAKAVEKVAVKPAPAAPEASDKAGQGDKNDKLGK